MASPSAPTSTVPAAKQSSGRLLPEVYESLRRLAERRMRYEAAGHTLQATALVHEVYLRLVASGELVWDGPAHFYGAAAEAMRRVLVDWARRKGRGRRGGTWVRVPIDELERGAPVDPRRLLTLHHALVRLEEFDSRKAAIVKLRFFVGLDSAEIAQLLQVSSSTVHHDWAFARAWLRREMGSVPMP